MLNKESLIARGDDDQLAEVNRLLAAVTGKHNLHKKDRSFRHPLDNLMLDKRIFGDFP
ncbi:hypothetical protein [Brevibacillus panacihumi]|uniref:hypothetical protein n=1 Tax=Brevibacillus panacihumi TaxID=497735 RepID=UPI001FE9CFEA|nr:hypothetical protein [Brevibacillus panacihumi]